MYPCFLTPHLLEALQDTPVVFLAGARQVGKSTLVCSLGYGRYLTLDDPLVLASTQHDPLAFLQTQEGPLVLEEVQRTRGGFPEAVTQKEGGARLGSRPA